MENSRIISLMAKKAGRSASPEELDELYVLLKDDPGYGYLQEVFASLKGNDGHLEMVTPREELTSHGWRDLSVRLNGGRAVAAGVIPEEAGASGFGTVMRMWRRPLGWAAAAAVLVLMWGGWYLGRGRARQVAAAGRDRMLVAQAGFGATTRLVLSDGTKVWLNAGSRLRYPQIFSGGRREVELEGEAFFDVARDARASFSVHARKVTIGVLGTSFNVKAYGDDSDIETTLITGKVQVTLDKEPEKKILLSPREKLTIMDDADEDSSAAETEEGRKAPEKVLNALRYQVQVLPHERENNFGETAWLNNRLAFNNTSFEDVARQLERRFDVQVRFEDESLKQEYISGVFEKEGIGQVLEILRMTTRFDYRVEGRTIYLSKK